MDGSKLCILHDIGERDIGEGDFEVPILVIIPVVRSNLTEYCFGFGTVDSAYISMTDPRDVSYVTQQ